MGKSKVYVLFQIMARVGYVEQKFNIISNATQLKILKVLITTWVTQIVFEIVFSWVGATKSYLCGGTVQKSVVLWKCCGRHTGAYCISSGRGTVWDKAALNWIEVKGGFQCSEKSPYQFLSIWFFFVCLENAVWKTG